MTKDERITERIRYQDTIARLRAERDEWRAALCDAVFMLQQDPNSEDAAMLRDKLAELLGRNRKE